MKVKVVLEEKLYSKTICLRQRFLRVPDLKYISFENQGKMHNFERLEICSIQCDQMNWA